MITRHLKSIGIALLAVVSLWLLPHESAALVTRYVDNRLTTGANNGTTAADAYRTLETMRAGIAGQTVDIVSFVAGSGPYREAFSTRATRNKTDLSFQASDRSLNSTVTDLTTFSFAANDIVQVFGSPLNSKQLTISTVATNKIVFITSNTVVDEAAGATVNVTSLMSGSNLAALDPAGNGNATDKRRWLFNGVEIDGGRTLNAANGYTWTASATAGEWYVKRSDGSNPSLISPKSGTLDDAFIADTADFGLMLGTVGSLTSRLVMGWGDNDTIGYSTVYLKSADTPENHTLRISQVEHGIYTSFQNHVFEDGVFSYANNNITNGAGITNISSTIWRIKRCILKFQAAHGVESSSGSPTFVESTVTYFSGHRGYYLSGNSELTVINSLDYGSHLFALIGVSVTSAGKLTIRNSIAVYQEAGVIDKKSSAAVLIENSNVWYPRFGASGAALGYVSTANWTTTHATDYPPSAATTISTVAANVSAGGRDPSLTAPTDTYFVLSGFKPTDTISVKANGGPAYGMVYITGVSVGGKWSNPDRGPWSIDGIRPRLTRP